MPVFIFSLLTIAQLSTGRRVSLYTQWRPMLMARGLAAIIIYLQRARAHDLVTKALEHRWNTQENSGVYEPETHALDSLVNQILLGMHDMVSGQLRGLGEHEPLYQVATEFLSEVFPAGAGVITRLPYVEEVTVVENIVTTLATTLAGHVDALGLGNIAARLAQVFPKYRQAVDADNSKRVTFAQVRNANRRGMAYVAELAFMILAEYHDSDDPAHVAAREELLAPLMKQDARARADWRSRRRGQVDSEPELDGEPEPDGEPGPDGEPEPDGEPRPEPEPDQETQLVQRFLADTKGTTHRE